MSNGNKLDGFKVMQIIKDLLDESMAMNPEETVLVEAKLVELPNLDCRHPPVLSLD